MDETVRGLQLDSSRLPGLLATRAEALFRAHARRDDEALAAVRHAIDCHLPLGEGLID